MKVRYLDLSVKDPGLKSRLLAAVDRVLSHGRVILGPEVEQFERRVAEYCGRKHCLGVDSGTGALYVALRALDIGPGDEVITTPMSWIATTNAIVLTGARPVFVDVGQDQNLDPDLIEAAITEKTRLILPVHYTGKMCRMDQIVSLAEKHGLDVVEDAAQAFGASLNGRRAGSFGRLSCFSMNSMKVFHSYGEAGAVVTDETELYDKMVSLRYNGTINREDCHWPSLNFRLQTLQAALLLVEFERLDQIIGRRRAIAARYTRELKEVVGCPEPDGEDVYYTYAVLAERRDELKSFLESRGVETKIHHSILMPDQAAYRESFQPDIPAARRLIRMILSLPNHEKMTEAEVDYVASCVREFYGAGS